MDGYGMYFHAIINIISFSDLLGSYFVISDVGFEFLLFFFGVFLLLGW